MNSALPSSEGAFLPLPTAGEGGGEGESFNIAPKLIAQVQAQYESHRRAYEDSLAEEQAALTKAKEDLAAAVQIREKLASLLPTYRQEEDALKKLGEKNLAPKLAVIERQRKRIEAEQDLKAQEKNMKSLRATIVQTEKKLAQITSRYCEQLHNERIETQAQLDKLQQELAKQEHRNTLLELKAPQDGIVKDLATHTLGAVVSPGTVLMTLVPSNETLQAEVIVKNQDIGFVHEGQSAKLKFAAYPFQKYGLIEGKVVHVSADASDLPAATEDESGGEGVKQTTLGYKVILQLSAQSIEKQSNRFDLSAGMQVTAEINQGTRTVMQYLLSPAQGVFHESFRER